jgi:hypothetical protein
LRSCRRASLIGMHCDRGDCLNIHIFSRGRDIS